MCSYNYIGDCASAIITVLINGKCGEAYNTANPDVRLTIAQLAEIIASAANRKVVFADPDDVDLAYRTPIAKQVLPSFPLWHRMKADPSRITSAGPSRRNSSGVRQWWT